MTEPATPVPAGWYPDPSGEARSRWWDGTQWTENYTEPGATAAGAVPTRVNVYTPWMWAIVGLLAMTIVSLLTFNIRDYMSYVVLSPSPYSLFTPGYLILIAVSFLVFWGGVVFAFLDHRALARGGVDRPFHWAFAFVSLVVYCVGRAVVLKRRVGFGSATLWIAVGYLVVTLAIVVFWMAQIISVMSMLMY